MKNASTRTTAALAKPLAHYLPDVSDLIFGCMRLGDWGRSGSLTNTELARSHSAIDVALDCNINVFDHADIYSAGRAERCFAEILKQRPALRNHIYLQSKCGIRMPEPSSPKCYDLSYAWIISSVENTLKRLCTDYLDVLLLHRPDPLMAPDEIAKAFHDLRSAGKVRFFGVSNMHQHQMMLIQSALDEPLVVNQIEMSLLNLDWLEEGVLVGHPDYRDRSAVSGVLEHCRLNHVQVQSWGSLGQGLYSGRDVSGENKPVRETAQCVEQLAAEYQVSREAVVLAWLLKHPVSMQAVIGSTNPDRIRSCAEASELTLTREHWYLLYEKSRGSELP